MTGEVPNSNSPRTVRFPLFRMVGPNQRIQWLTEVEAAILYGGCEAIEIGGKVADSIESPPRPITPEEEQRIIDISKNKN